MIIFFFFKKKIRCGVQCDVNSYECPNQKNGYPCCQTCDVYLTDADGKWGVENGNVCINY